MRTLSSAWTWFYKFAFPSLWIGGFGLGTVALFVAPGEHAERRWSFLAAWVAGSSLVYWSCIRIKKVSLDNDSFVISNFRRELRVPIRDVERVTATVMWNPELIWLHFRRPTEFGSKVVFIAPVRFFGFGRHPVARELHSLVTQAAAA